MFFSVVLFPIFLAMSFMVDEPGPLLVPFFAFLAGLALMIYARLFLDEIPVATVQAPPYSFGTMPPTNALPPASSIGMSSIGAKQVRTSELAQPASVTENTTRLLNNETEPDR